MSSSRRMQVLLAVELHFGAAVLAEEDAVADLDVERADLAVLEDLAVADGDDLALDGFSFAVSGMMMPPLVFSSSFTRLTITRSWSGRIFIGISSMRVSAGKRSAISVMTAAAVGPAF